VIPTVLARACALVTGRLCSGLFAVILVSACSSPRATTPKAAPSDVGIRRVFVLRHSDARSIADMLTGVVDASERAMGARHQGSCALMLPEVLARQKELSSQRNLGLRFVADPSTNAVIVTVRAEDAEDLERVAELIRRLDDDRNRVN
jgi:type II secretory pathway component GspD/PulD (secretin)